MERRINIGMRDMLLVILGVVLGGWFSTFPSLNAQAPPQPTNAQGCGDWVMQTRQTQTKDFNAFVLNTRTGEVFFLKDENKLPIKSQ